jgi:hypothetical protein
MPLTDEEHSAMRRASQFAKKLSWAEDYLHLALESF